MRAESWSRAPAAMSTHRTVAVIVATMPSGASTVSRHGGTSAIAVITRTHAAMVAASANGGVDARHHGVMFARNVETGIAATATPSARSGRSTVPGWLSAATTL